MCQCGGDPLFLWLGKDIPPYACHLFPLNECLWFVATCTLAQLQKVVAVFVQIQRSWNGCAAALGGLGDTHTGLLPLPSYFLIWRQSCPHYTCFLHSDLSLFEGSETL